MSEAVIVPSLTLMTSTVSEESLARDTHTHTHRLWVVYVKLFKVAYNFENKNDPFSQPF